MPINQDGLRLLADDLVMHAEMYHQARFGIATECGTFACMAGLCYLRVVGLEQFRAESPKDYEASNVPFSYRCLDAATTQLGLAPLGFPCNHQIFRTLNNWPEDLWEDWRRSASTPLFRALLGLRALQRLLPDGTIDQNPEAIHNPLPEHIAMVREMMEPPPAQEKLDALFSKARLDLAANDVYDLAELR